MQPEEYEDYLEAIINHSITRINTGSLEKLSEVSGKNSEDTKKDLFELEKNGYIKTDDKGGITLTEEGRRTGECTIKKHRVLEAFLTEMLGIEPDTASKGACVLEHGASEDTINRLKNYIRGHGRCRRRGEHEMFSHFYNCGGKPLTGFSEEDKVVILCTMGGPGRTNRLHDLGIIPGEKIIIKRKLSNGAMVVIIKSCEIGLSPEIASSVFVERI
ncbi:DtxR family Mn-dependent transcriptional regulator [Methanomicrobium sp. W14]|uniref:metal-dependent transcriptional regulator n=1 Tax=Methanomicrobium sp. W14 TaxID=2817839 RepID=UPI001AE211EA|nr:metal-dependent transcriptional regulator [Methanomicrobium sp. W14]MBP2134478.1 DtxR family Mn-dependent transcriptional regulator [Methanomicrobium sp. W14]